MVIRALDIVSQCYTQDDGAKVFNAIFPLLDRGSAVVLSFAGVETAPSSFVNTALIALLDYLTFDEIKARLRVVDSTRQINEMIKTRFDFEVNRRAGPRKRDADLVSCHA